MPDFFVIGAPKCGTTAIYSYLRTHPNVFMSQIKEPHYFCYDLPGLRKIINEQEYLAMFADAPFDAVIGEASASYLFSKIAIKEILKQNPMSKMIAALRNPIDMVHAFHSERLYNMNEDIVDFESAWNLEDERRKGHHIPRYCREPKLLQYRELCRFSSQIERFFESVPQSQRMVFILEEFEEDSQSIYKEILHFLELPDDGRSEFQRLNTNKVLRSRRLARWHRSAQAKLKQKGWYGAVKIAANTLGMHPSRFLSGWYVVRRPRHPISERFRHQLAEELMSDVRALESLLGRRLDCWKDFALSNAHGA